MKVIYTDTDLNVYKSYSVECDENRQPLCTIPETAENAEKVCESVENENTAIAEKACTNVEIAERTENACVNAENVCENAIDEVCENVERNTPDELSVHNCTNFNHHEPECNSQGSNSIESIPKCPSGMLEDIVCENTTMVPEGNIVNKNNVHMNALIQECEYVHTIECIDKTYAEIIEPENVNVVMREVSEIPTNCRIVTIVNGVYCESLVDTGCYSVLIKAKALRAMWQSQAFVGDKMLQRQASGSVGITANGSTISLTHTTYLEIEIGGRTIATNAWICESLSEDIILGKTFLDKLSPFYFVPHGIDIDTNGNRKFVPFLGHDSKHSDLHMYIVSKDTVQFKPGECKIIEIQMNSKVKILNGLNLLLCPHPGWEKKEILIENSLVNNFGPYYMSVLNCSNDTFVLTKDECIGRADWVSGQPTCTVRMRGNKLKKCVSKGSMDGDKMFNSCVHECMSKKRSLKMQNVLAFTQVTLADRHKFLDENLDLDKDASWLTDDQRKYLKELVYQYADIVSTSAMDIGRTTLAEHEIDTGDHTPISQKPYRVEHSLRDIIEEHVHKMLEIDLIEPCKSPWSSPVVIIPKSDGEKRFCIDYRKINRITTRDCFPLPRIDDIIPLIGKNKYFIGLDLASGYWQVPMSEKYDSINKTAFVCHMGTFRFKYMPFGGINCPATFQRLMNVCLEGLLDKICFVYLDDILIVGKTYDEAMKNLQTVFERLRKANLKIKLKKCEFAKRSIKYLGHMIDENGIKVNPKKIDAISKLATPKNAREVKSALGMITFYAKFIPHYSDLVKPLHEASKKRKVESFEWTDLCQKNWDKIKEVLCSDIVLAYPDRTKEFNLYCDASTVACGAVLTQFTDDNKERPIGFFSKMFKPNEIKWNITEKETTAVIWSLENFRPYLYGGRCTVYTDNNACVWLSKRDTPSRNVAIFQFHMLGEVDWEVKYIPGQQNVTADFLSRFPIDLKYRDEDEHESDENIENINAINEFTEEFVNVDIPSGKKYKSTKIVGGHMECDSIHTAISMAYEQNCQTFAFDICHKDLNSLKNVDKDAWKSMIQKYEFKLEHIIPHAFLKMNTGTIKQNSLNACRKKIIQEINHIDSLGIMHYVLHPGSAINQISREECMERIAETINYAHERTRNVIILVENMSGAGRLVGNTFEELACILDHVVNKERIGICLDTCHAFAKGYNLDSVQGYNEMIKEFDDKIGLNMLKAIHLNDSKEGKGMKHDRHETIGKGKIAIEVFHAIMQDSRLNGIPMILETPSKCYKAEVELLYNFEDMFMSCNAVALEENESLDVFERELITKQNSDLECQFMIDFIKYPEKYYAKNKHGMEVLKVHSAKHKRWVELQSKYYFVDEDGLLKRLDPGNEDCIQTIVPRCLVLDVLRNFHGFHLSGHPGIKTMLTNVKRTFYWKHMDVDIIKFCQNCEKCIEFKRNAKFRTPLKPYLPTTIFEMVNTDICGPFNESNNGNKYVVGFIDQLSRFAITEAIPDQKAETIAKVYMEKVCFVFGPAVKLLSDQGKPYISELLKQIASLVNTIKIQSTAYHPQTNGLIERFWQRLKEEIGMFCVDPEMKDWDEGLQVITYAYNCSAKSNLGVSPMEILTGNKPRMPLEFFKLPRNVDLKDTDEFVRKRVKLIRQIQKKVCEITAKDKQKQKERYDKKAKPHSFKNGDLVYKRIEVQVPGVPRKLQPKYEGPHKIVHLFEKTAILQIDCNPEITEQISLDRLKKANTDIEY